MNSVCLARIHRRTALGTALEEARGCSSESGIMVLEQKPARKQGTGREPPAWPTSLRPARVGGSTISSRAALPRPVSGRKGRATPIFADEPWRGQGGRIRFADVSPNP